MINKKINVIFSIFLMFFLALFFFSCASGGGDDPIPIQKVELNLTKFSYKSDFPNSNQNLFKSSTPSFATSILSNGNILELTPKNANKELIGCYDGEENCDPDTNIRTFKEADIVDFTKNSVVFGTLVDYARYVSFEIYNSDKSKRLYKTVDDVDIGENTNSLRVITFNLHPTGNANLDTGTLNKKWQFNLPLSNVTNDVFSDSSPAKIQGTTICASPDNGSNYPATNFSLTHDSSSKKLYSAQVSADNLYVKSPCRLRVAAYDSNNKVIIDGQIQFEVSEDKEQEVDAIHFDSRGQAILSFMQIAGTNIITFSIEYSALETSIKEFLSRDPNLKYKLHLVANNFDKRVDLSLKDGVLKGEVAGCPLNISVETTLELYKDNENSSWLDSTKTLTYKQGETVKEEFPITYKKTINTGISTTKGHVSITVRDDSGNAIPNADVSFSTTNSNGDITEKTNSNGVVERYDKGLIHGYYMVNISADGYYPKAIGFQLPENGMINKTVELIKQNYFPYSKILTSRAQEQKLNQWYGNSNQKWKLCYRRSTHGASSYTFHSKCNNKGPTISIIKLDNSKIIGGYLSQSWNSSYERYYYTPNRRYYTSYYKNNAINSFLFSLTNNFKYNHGNSYYIYAPNYYYYIYNSANNNFRYMYWYYNTNLRYYAYDNKYYGPAFGGGDLRIYSNMTTGYANIGHTYRTRIGSYGSSTARNDFAGSYNSWRVSELEVFYRN